MIEFNTETKTFHLGTAHSSYLIKILENGMLCHWYYGDALPLDDMDYYHLFRRHEYMPTFECNGHSLSRDTAPQEYPTYGNGDYRNPALIVENTSGRCVNDLVYKEHRIIKGRPALKGLPAFTANTEGLDTLEIVLTDSVMRYEVSLFYSVYEAEDAITRHAVIRNTTEETVRLLSAQSLSMDFQSVELEIINLCGTWARERHIVRRALSEGSFSFESRKGASGHQFNPFAALVSPDTNENSGSAYGFALVYSGNFKISAEVDPFSSVRLQAGINPHGFTYILEPGESFTTPEAISVYSNQGLNGMSHCFHDMCRNHLGRSARKTQNHPILINSWEAMYFDMSDERVCKFVNDCKGLGIDTFVLDDGWFGSRNNDYSSLGDWFVDRAKFPNGLHNIIKSCKENGMKFGIWFEPEMISRDSELFRAHPDWCIHVSDKDPVESRHQLVLDMARPEVVDYVYEQIAAILNEYDISYVKWDMNRNITDNGSNSLPPERQGEHAHRYILNVYQLMDRLTRAFPEVLFEGCAGGGGRFDFGVLYYMPQIWTSDDTDAIERLKIQYGTSFVYPPAAMSAHVSACPNHQTSRSVSFKTRGDVAQICNFGYELDVSRLTEAEHEQIKEQIALHKRIEPLIYEGDFYRLCSPFEKDYCSWQLVSKDQNTSFAVFATQKTTPNTAGFFLKLKGLHEEKLYTVKPLGVKLRGKTLMSAGLPITNGLTDFTTTTFELTAEE